MNKERYTTKDIAVTGIMSAILIVLMFIASYVPIIGYIGALTLPIPINIIYLRYNKKIAIGCMMISCIISVGLFGPISAILYLLNYGIIGIILGYCNKKNIKSYTLLITIVLSWILVIGLSILLIIGFVEKTSVLEYINTVATTIQGYFVESINKAKITYEQMGAPAEFIEILELSKQLITTEYIIAILPLTISILGFIGAYILIAINNSILKKLRIKYVKTLSFTEFYITNLVGAALIGLRALLIILNSKMNITTTSLIIFLGLFIEFMLAINGMAAISYFFIRKKKLSPIAVAVIIGITYPLGLGKIYAGIGFAEMILDFRKLDPHRIFKSKGA
ncbi:MAG: DUF2232 domain-containing protein [Clostridium sp.]